jgi:serine/threonine-protein kinase PpkA
MSVTQAMQSVDIPGYRLLRSLGEGGMASVYLAMQESLDREVALKVMSPSLAANTEFAERFLKEGRLAAKLSHPNLVTVYDIGQHGGIYYLAQEFIPGGTLRERMLRTMSVAETLDVMRDVALGLAFAHEKGVVHRDVKPANVLFRANGNAVLADFGIAKAMNSNTMATQAGNSIGTPHYMSPEQARAEKVDGRSDLYSLGAMMFELLTGAPPFDSSDPYTIALMHVTHPIPKLPAPVSWLQPLLDKLMAKLPDQRFRTGDEFVVACEKLIATAPEAKAMREAMATRKRTATRAAVRSGEDAEATRRGLAITQDTAAGASSPSPPRPWLWAVFGGGVLVIAVMAWSMFGRRASDAGVTPAAHDSAVVADANIDADAVVPTADAPTPIMVEGDVGSLLAKAKEYTATGLLENGRRLTSQFGPAGDNAVDIYRRVLALDPENDQAREGLRRIADYFESKAKQVLDSGRANADVTCNVILENALMADPERESVLKLLANECKIQLP